MQPEAVRTLILERVDKALGRLFIPAQDRKLLQALRAYAMTMTNEDLARFGTFIPYDFDAAQE